MLNAEASERFRSGRRATAARALELANGCARALAGGRVPPTAAGVLSALLAQQLLPQLESDVRLATGVAGGERETLAAELTESRQALGRLVEELDRAVLASDGRDPRSPAPRRRMARTLAGVGRLLERYLATDDRLWKALAAGCSDEDISALVEEAEATGRRAAGALRFVWHPPVPETDAKALWWTSPKTRRVFVVDAAGAAALDGLTGGGSAGRREL
ncbi:MAG: hypothetical protein J2P38_04820 [Candidatus Dormibacteraeota bacterium]|nr:hypothetical protein [Candidatus Dormibacteraeota bacterium]